MGGKKSKNHGQALYIQQIFSSAHILPPSLKVSRNPPLLQLSSCCLSVCLVASLSVAASSFHLFLVSAYSIIICLFIWMTCTLESGFAFHFFGTEILLKMTLNVKEKLLVHIALSRHSQSLQLPRDQSVCSG